MQRLIEVAFGLRTGGGTLHEVVGSAAVNWREFGDEFGRIVVLETVSLSSASVDGIPLSPSQLTMFVALYNHLFQEDLEWIALSSIG